ncbi:heavy-metal-associated domain-containing protein [Agromyces mangrovi Wang et al. 2018]|uniref:heavy-metal-associated domain-containing protein n=1 Tax=Agromyces mangrovi TaxID=1858653 RepID=UPI002573509B|nr:heavy-metal-associated domain-containing protein [Agromyces mangrovi]
MTETTRTELPLVSSDASSPASGGGCCGGGGCACGHGSSASAGASASGVATAEFLVEGMTCGHCVSSVTEELSEIAGVEQVSVDLRPEGASRVTVASSAPLAAHDVRAAVEDAGYRLAAGA